ncbi:MAG: GIY-YIG nuclease family protein [Patescibacteria group bacterium]|nr:GIY-YIG nuclease family protein [Patescibacteria group bacterium]MDD5715768.1 GIY-YIG nuclease family protein [Patescibacteria group bacterium]
MYTLYILKCKDKTLYTGITTDLARRVAEHRASMRGAKYTRGRGPVRVVYMRKYRTRSAASREEARIKKLPRAGKARIIDAQKSRCG